MTKRVEGRASAQTDQQSRTLGESLVDEVSRQADDLRKEAVSKAKDIGTQVKTAADSAKDNASQLLDTAKSVASNANQQIQTAVTTQKDAGADRISAVASIIRRTADDLEEEIPFAAPIIRRAAEEIDTFGVALKTQSLNDMTATIADFARRQPAMFLGITAAAGFAVVRVLKAPVAPGDRQ